MSPFVACTIFVTGVQCCSQSWEDASPLGLQVHEGKETVGEVNVSSLQLRIVKIVITSFRIAGEMQKL